jgi:predicted ATPase
MPARNVSENCKVALPFVGRQREIAELLRLHGERKHVLLLGPEGVGKTALVRHVSERVRLVVCAESERLAEICEALERELDLTGRGGRLLQRKNRLLAALRGSDATVVFDGVGWATPKLSSFLGCVAERVPVWVVTRSEHSWDIGHFWTMLARFARVEVKPFRLSETREVVGAVVQVGVAPRESLMIVEWLHRRSAGNPLVISELVSELATGRYDLTNPNALKRLNLDRRIHEVFPLTSAGGSSGGGQA